MKYGGGYDRDEPMADFDRRDSGHGDREWKRRGAPLDYSPPHKRRRDSRYDDYDDYDRDYRRSHDRRSRSHEREDREKRTERRLFDGPVLPMPRFVLEIRGEDFPAKELDEKYEAYVQEHAARSAKRFYEEHKDDEWYKERYHPDYVKELLEDRTAFCKKQAELFPKLVEEGKIDLDLDHKKGGPPFGGSDEAPKADSAPAPEEDAEMGDESDKDGEGEANDAEEKEEKEEEKDGSDAEQGDGEGDGEEVDTERPEDSSGDVKMEEEEKPKKKSKRDPWSNRAKNTVFVRSIPVTVSRKGLVSVLDTEDHPLSYLILAQPRHTNFERVAWAHYDDEATAAKACEAANGVEVDGYRVSAALKPERGPYRKIAPPATANAERMKKDSEQALLLAKLMDKEKDISSTALESLLEARSTVKERLDLTVAYLRRVHLFCYYCGEGFADLDMMRDRCGTLHIRGPGAEDEEADEQQQEWLDSLDKRNKLRLEDPPNFDVPSCEQLKEKAVEKFLAENTKQEGDDKFRCGMSYCAKLFCGKEFVTKHLSFKHADELELEKEKAELNAILQNFKEDPPRPKAPPPPPQFRRPPGPPPFGPGPVPFGRGRGFFGPPGPAFGGPPPFARGRGSPMAPPPGMSPDPRQIRQYIDLDAPVEAVPEIDYRGTVSYDDI